MENRTLKTGESQGLNKWIERGYYVKANVTLRRNHLTGEVVTTDTCMCQFKHFPSNCIQIRGFCLVASISFWNVYDKIWQKRFNRTSLNVSDYFCHAFNLRITNSHPMAFWLKKLNQALKNKFCCPQLGSASRNLTKNWTYKKHFSATSISSLKRSVWVTHHPSLLCYNRMGFYFFIFYCILIWVFYVSHKQ